MSDFLTLQLSLSFESILQPRQLSLQTRFDESLPPLMVADSNRLRQVSVFKSRESLKYAY